jgi:hypothetical protein
VEPVAVKRGVIPAKTLTFYPAAGGQSVLLPIQRGTIQGFEYVNPFDDLVDFFPVKEATSAQWPDDALKVLLEARDDYMASFEGPNDWSQKPRRTKSSHPCQRP